LAARFLPAIFFTRLRAASVLPRALLAFLRGMVRLAFRFRFATLRAERAPRAAAMMKSSSGLQQVSSSDFERDAQVALMAIRFARAS
jgi:hypothetical protein